MTQDRKPDWDFWSYVPDVTILQAVALSRDIDPNLINYRTYKLAYGEEVTKRDESPEFEKRLAICVRNLNTLEARGRYDVDELENCSVNLVKFTAVALSWNWKIPPEMAALAEPDKRDAEILNLKQQVEALTQERDKLSAEVTDLTAKLQAADEIPSERSRKSYLRIIAVLKEYIDGSFPTGEKHQSFESDAQLIALIDTKYQSYHGLSERNLQRIFPMAKQTLKES